MAQVGDETLAPRLVLQASAAPLLTETSIPMALWTSLMPRIVVAHWGEQISAADINGDLMVDVAGYRGHQPKLDVPRAVASRPGCPSRRVLLWPALV